VSTSKPDWLRTWGYDKIDEIKKEFEEAGVSVTQSEPVEYVPRKPQMSPSEAELIERAIRDREGVENL
jgi:hypothetical protein